jgi:hypothetical protein
VPIERTTLRGVKVHAPIAGKALTPPLAAKQRDAIWDFFFKIRGKATLKTFRTGQIDLAVVIESEDFKCAEERRDIMLDTDTITNLTRATLSTNHAEVEIGPISESFLVSRCHVDRFYVL